MYNNYNFMLYMLKYIFYNLLFSWIFAMQFLIYSYFDRLAFWQAEIQNFYEEMIILCISLSSQMRQSCHYDGFIHSFLETRHFSQECPSPLYQRLGEEEANKKEKFKSDATVIAITKQEHVYFVYMHIISKCGFYVHMAFNTIICLPLTAVMTDSF